MMFSNFPNLDNSQPARIQAELAVRAVSRSKFQLEINGNLLESDFAQRVTRLAGSGDNEINYANKGVLDQSISLTSGDVSITVNYPKPQGSSDGSEAWVDFVQINAWRNLTMVDDQMAFRDPNSTDASKTNYRLSNIHENILVWDISDPYNPINQTYNSTGNTLDFVTESSILHNFIAFNNAGTLKSAEAIGAIPNQDLRRLPAADLIIIYPEVFESEVLRLATHRENFSNLVVNSVKVSEVFNEFSSGSQDPTAIRDFAKYVLDNNPNFKYLLLFGDGSFDWKDIYGFGGNFIPVYERESFNPIFSFPSDDYYSILETNSPTDALTGKISIAIGRLPVNTLEEAKIVVDKIVNYDNSPKSYSDWRNRLVFNW